MTTMKSNYYTGDDAREFAARKAQYGHKNWIVWQDKSGQWVAAVRTAETVKQAMLATGTQGKFRAYLCESFPWHVDWSLAAMWLRNLKKGYMQ